MKSAPQRPSARDMPAVRRLVVKVGSTSLIDDAGRASARKLAKVVREVADVAAGGRQCVLVSSGAVASGFSSLGLKTRPKTIAKQQAAAAVGQGRLMAEYLARFARRGLVAGQVLLTQEDFIRRRQFVNAKATFDELLSAGVVPVVNENDTVATDEIRFGDNDRLAALVSVMVGADLLILLSDVDGIFTRSPGHRSAELLTEVTDPLHVRATGPRSGTGSGGMASKLQAAFMATAAGVPTVVANAGQPHVLSRVLDGEPLGTWLPATSRPKRARKAWVAFVASPRGSVLVDAGAKRAVQRDGRSLLAAGVLGVRGSFASGDIVEVSGPDERPFARGVANYAADELPDGSSRRRDRPQGKPGPYHREVIHRDELVLLEEDG